MNIEISELAEAMEVHRNTLSQIAHDKGALTTPMAITLAAAQAFSVYNNLGCPEDTN